MKDNKIKRIPLERLMDYYDGTTEDWREGTYEERVKIIERLSLGEEVSIERMYASKIDVTQFNNIIKRLQEEGLDLDKGNSKYGYKMPLPKKDDYDRELIIFRRR